MKVILNQTVPKVGKEGQVVTVAGGYARNYLFPKKMAIVADKRQVAALDRRNAKVTAQHADTKAGAEAEREKMNGLVVKLEGKVGKDTGKLFGAITSQDVADALKAQHGLTIEKKQVGLMHPIKRLGDHEITIDLHREVDAKITVNVFDPEAPIVAPPAPPAPLAEPINVEDPEDDMVEA